MASDPGCPTAESYTLTATLSVGTATATWLAALPFGAWTITWKNNTSSATGSQNVTLSPTNPTVPNVTASVVTVT